MWVHHLRNGVRSNVSKLTNTMFVVERFPAFARQYDVQRCECLAPIRVVVLRITLVEQGSND